MRALQSTYVANMLDQMSFPNGEAGPDGKRAMLPFNKASPPEPNTGGGASSASDSGGGGASGSQLKAHSEATRRATWTRMYPKASPVAIDLVERLMQYDPQKRMSAAEGLRHEYCAQFHDPESEVTYAHGRVAISVHDNKKLSVSKYRDLLYEKCGANAKAK